MGRGYINNICRDNLVLANTEPNDQSHNSIKMKDKRIYNGEVRQDLIDRLKVARDQIDGIIYREKRDGYVVLELVEKALQLGQSEILEVIGKIQLAEYDVPNEENRGPKTEVPNISTYKGCTCALSGMNPRSGHCH